MMRLMSAYSLTSALCAVLNVMIVVLFDRLGFNLLSAVALSFVACVIAGFALHSRFTFRSPMSVTGLLRYTGAMAANFPLSLVTIWLFRDTLALPMSAAAVLSTLLLTAYNFVSSRWALSGSAQ